MPAPYFDPPPPASEDSRVARKKKGKKNKSSPRALSPLLQFPSPPGPQIDIEIPFPEATRVGEPHLTPERFSLSDELSDSPVTKRKGKASIERYGSDADSPQGLFKRHGYHSAKYESMKDDDSS
ncbi:hypothetical protein CERZMDRAFT_88925 [Cercospora zeae-maydis SCOH1-5]|uniref:Uncharacterized protein n=1 Tax=Cercospora zeae-maydis SCOH1-5 TaxID=717836 RepID=A0A6A6F106_9PEZI|nr:hypothetical protein CERZMDRAFT_88925 [Cercospora zeae-maydis SCOH1-5]